MCLDYIILFSFLWGLTFPPDNTQILRFQICLGRILPITDFTKSQSLRRKINNHIVFRVLFFCLFSFTLPQGKVICVLLLFVCFLLLLLIFVFFCFGGLNVALHV